MKLSMPIPVLIYHKVPKLEMGPFYVGGSQTVACETDHFELRKLMFENLYWPYNSNHVASSSKNFETFENTILTPSLNLELRMPQDPEKFNEVYFTKRTNFNKVIDFDAKPVTKFTFNKNFLLIEDLDESLQETEQNIKQKRSILNLVQKEQKNGKKQII